MSPGKETGTGLQGRTYDSSESINFAAWIEAGANSAFDSVGRARFVGNSLSDGASRILCIKRRTSFAFKYLPKYTAACRLEQIKFNEIVLELRKSMRFLERESKSCRGWDRLYGLAGKNETRRTIHVTISFAPTI